MVLNQTQINTDWKIMSVIMIFIILIKLFVLPAAMVVFYFWALTYLYKHEEVKNRKILLASLTIAAFGTMFCLLGLLVSFNSNRGIGVNFGWLFLMSYCISAGLITFLISFGIMFLVKMFVVKK